MKRALLTLSAVCLFISAAQTLEARTLKVLVYSELYRYGKAGFELAEMLDSLTTADLQADFTNTENSLSAETLAGYDVLVLFNHNDITERHEKNITEFVSSGGGVVALHHVINKANSNPELIRLIGGYYLVEGGIVEHRDFQIMKIPGKTHPIFEQVPEKIAIKNDQDFRMQFFPGEEVNRLFTCDITDNGPQEDSGWTRTEGAGRVFFFSPGDAVEERPFIVNKAIGRVIVNAIVWAARQ